MAATSETIHTPKPKAGERADGRHQEAQHRGGIFQQQTNFRPRQSQPCARVEIIIHTSFAQKAIRRAYERAMLSTYAISVTQRLIAGRNQAELIDVIETGIRKKINEVYEWLEAEVARQDALRNDVRLAAPDISFQGHTDPRKVSLPFYTPLTLQYVGVIRKLDELLRIVDELTILGHMTESERMRYSHKATNRVQHLALTIDQMNRNARRRLEKAIALEEANRKHRKEVSEIHLESTSGDDAEASGASGIEASQLEEAMHEGLDDLDNAEAEPIETDLASYECVTEEAVEPEPEPKK